MMRIFGRRGSPLSRRAGIDATLACVACVACVALCGCASPATPVAPLRVAPDTAATVLSFDGAIEALAAKFVSHGGRVAVLDFPDLTRRQTQLGQLVSQSLTTSLVLANRNGRLRVLERLQVDQLLRELNFASTNVTEDQVEHIGRALNADALIFGTAAPAGSGTAIVNARMVEVAGRTIIEAARVTVRIPMGLSLAAIPPPDPPPAAAASTHPPASDDPPGEGAPLPSAGSAAPLPSTTGNRLVSLVTIAGATWIFELEQCARGTDAHVACDFTVTNWGAESVLALFFGSTLTQDGYTRVIDDKNVPYAPGRIRFSPSGPAFAFASYPASAIATRDDVRRYPTHAPIHLTLELDTVPEAVRSLRTVELVGGSMPIAFHDVVVTFHDVTIGR